MGRGVVFFSVRCFVRHEGLQPGGEEMIEQRDHPAGGEGGQQRAEALKAYLVKLGAPAKNIKCKSKGPKEPVADNKTKEGRALNRRATVEVK